MDDDILLVDDDPGTIRVLASILADVANLSFAISGEDALRMARQSVPDLILLDAEMPGMSGFLVCEALTAASELAHVPVIFVTSHRRCACHRARRVGDGRACHREHRHRQLRCRQRALDAGLGRPASRRPRVRALLREGSRACGRQGLVRREECGPRAGECACRRRSRHRDTRSRHRAPSASPRPRPRERSWGAEPVAGHPDRRCGLLFNRDRSCPRTRMIPKAPIPCPPRAGRPLGHDRLC